MRLLTVLLSSFCLFRSSFAAGRQPNVLFILADDLGWSDTTLFGTTKFYQTPNVERLAKRGVVFTQAYAASPLCSPTLGHSHRAESGTHRTHHTELPPP